MTYQFRPNTLAQSEIPQQLPEVAHKIRGEAGASLGCDNVVIFPLSGILAVSALHHDARYQVAFAAKGDVVGIHSLFAPTSPRFTATVISQGEFLSIPAEVLQSIMQKNQKFAERLVHYAFKTFGVFMREIANRTGLTVDQRVAKWLADYRRAAGTNTVAVTHQLIASALQVRRSSVTEATHVLEGQKLVRTRRACVEIIDPARLYEFCKANQG